MADWGGEQLNLVFRFYWILILPKHFMPLAFIKMLQTFTTLARTLNLSRTVKELNITRQTVRRYILDLEQIRNEKLFSREDNRYFLTKEGMSALGEAEAVIDAANAWVKNQQISVNGLEVFNLSQSDNSIFFAQRHTVNQIWNLAPLLLKNGFRAWVNSKGQLEHNSFKKIRPYLVVYRKYRDDWICVEVGEKSSFATWLGLSWAKSTIGCSFNFNPKQTEADNIILLAYEKVAQTGSVWYDHVATSLPRGRDKENKNNSVNYQRIVFSCLFPNGETAVASLIARTNNISIEGIQPADIGVLADSDLMEYDI